MCTSECVWATLNMMVFFGVHYIYPLCQTHSAGIAECPPSCSHDPPHRTLWKRFQVAPEDQEVQVVLGHQEDQGAHAVRQS